MFLPACKAALRRRFRGISPLLAPLAMALAACGADPPPPDRFQVALLLAGPENDEGWNQSAFEGLQRIERELGAEVRKLRARDATAIEQAFAAAAANGCDLVVGHGFEFNAPAARIAAAHPQVRFATSGGTESGPNLASVSLRIEEVTFQLGILAAHLSRSGVVSSLHGEAYEPVKRAAAAFAAGARAVNPAIVLHEEYLGTWEDAVLAKEKALAHASRGADVFFQNADAAGAGIFEACRAKGALAFGCNRDQAGKAPDVIVASAVGDTAALLLELAKETQSGTFRGGVRTFGLAEGSLRVAFNPALAARVPAAARTAIDDAARRIRSGELVVSAP
ncbi:MAG: BMP family ABC transporter substrate-binding protein [Planctomycetes bacterium]|nr:BMP family ABC transporter substrate-binding protein [Planctomycetota bacterium]